MKRSIISFALASFVFVGGASAALISDVQVTGGDGGEGFNGSASAGSYVLAYSVNNTSGTAQNVTFPNTTATLTVTAPGPTTGVTGSTVTLSNDTNTASDITIRNVVGSFLYQGGVSASPLTLGVSGLTPNGSYVAQILAATDGSPRNMDVSINGVLQGSITGVSGNARDFSASFTATGTGTASIVLQQTSDYTFLSGLVISSSAVPEPASLGLFAIAGAALLGKRSRRGA
ncbi:MAG TPA: PEP-CTERM sorting domain-containing protein [Tepidisphaeraceae bacterium]|jgi:hypothetical protein